MLAGGADTDMHADADADLAGEFPIVLGDVERRELGAARRERQRQQLIGRGEILRGDTFHVVRMLEAAVVPPRRHVQVRRAVGKHRSQPGLLQALIAASVCSGVF